jgi:hypothetical protein
MKTKLLAGFSFFLALAFVCAPVNNVFADKVLVSVNGHYGPAGTWIRTVTNSAGSVSAANSDSTWSIKATTSMGRIDLDMTAIDGTYPYSGYAYAVGLWDNTVTILPDDPALLGTGGTAVFTYHLSGSQSLNRYYACDNSWSLATEAGGGPNGRDYGDGTYAGQHISDVPTYTVARSFTFGGPVFEEMDLSGDAVLETYSGGEGKMHLSLVTGSIAVYDNAGHSVAYSSTSSAGVARAVIFTNAVSYAGFSVTNNLGNQTALAVLGGTNATGSNETVATTFTSPPNTNQFVSDVADFSGTDSNLFVLQLSYNPLAAIALFGSETNVSLLWFKQASNTWVNAVEGNSDGGLVRQFFQGAFNLATQFHLGNFGVDTVRHAVWAVVNHNSQFAVGVVAPPLRLAGISAGTNGASLKLSGPPTGQFLIDYSSSLVAPNWTLLGLTTLDTNGTAIFTDATSVSANPQRFYRARQ